jgi:SAM-dependent methyltransferase
VDVVTAWEVLEHAPNPRAMLAEIRRVLRPGGALLLSTPNAGGWQAGLWREHWAGWHMPRHMQVFTPETLARLLRETGFCVARRAVFPGERFFVAASLRSRLGQHRGRVLRTAVGLLARAVGLAGWPIFTLLDRLSGASALVIEARAVEAQGEEQ